MVRTRSTSSELTRGRPTRLRHDFQVQKARKPCRCQRITVSGRTTWRASRHPAHRWESHTQKRRSRRPNCGRFERRRSSTSCCRSARFSSARSVRVLSDARSAPNRAKTRDIVPWLARRSAIVQSLRKDFGKRHHVSDVVGPQIFEENVADDGPGVEPQSGCFVVGSADAARGALRAIAPRRL